MGDRNTMSFNDLAREITTYAILLTKSMSPDSIATFEKVIPCNLQIDIAYANRKHSFREHFLPPFPIVQLMAQSAQSVFHLQYTIE